MRGVTLRQLRAFALVAERHSFVKAAAELHLTPSAVSLQIKELEQCAGLSLFVRDAKHVSLTHAGDLLLVDVHRALDALDHSEEMLARLRGSSDCVIAIGMVSNAEYFLPRLLAYFREQHRSVELHLSVGNRQSLIEQLRRGEVDLAVMGAPPPELEAHAESFATQPLGIVASPQHALARRRSIPAAALTGQEFIVREPGSGTRAAMDRFFRHAAVVPKRSMEMTSNEAIKQMVIASMSLAFLSLHTAGLELQEDLLVAIDVVGLPIIRRWFVVHRDLARLTDAARQLRRFILERGAQQISLQYEGSTSPAHGNAIDDTRQA